MMKSHFVLQSGRMSVNGLAREEHTGWPPQDRWSQPPSERGLRGGL